LFPSFDKKDKNDVFERIDECRGCSTIQGKLSTTEYDLGTFSRNSLTKISLRVTPIYYKNALTYESYSGYSLQLLSIRSLRKGDLLSKESS
jgi:hypothetical protein